MVACIEDSANEIISKIQAIHSLITDVREKIKTDLLKRYLPGKLATSPQLMVGHDSID